MRPLAAISCCVATTHSANRDIGTQTSVTTTLAPGRKERSAQKISCRAFHNRERSSAMVAHSNGLPVKIADDFAKPFGLLGNTGIGAVEFHEQHRRLYKP